MLLTKLIEANNVGKTVKQILKNDLGLSERLVKRLKFSDKVLLNSSPVHVNVIVKSGDLVQALVEFVETCDDMLPQDIPLSIIYEDEYLIAIDKQPGIVVHPTSTHPDSTIANALLYHYKSNNENRKIRPVSRLDRNTSGLILFAKNEFIQEKLVQQMNEGIFHKEYLGVVQGILSPLKGTFNLPIRRMPDSIMLRETAPDGALAVTHYEVLQHFKNASFVHFSLETGRTHQIRVHCKSSGNPIYGDTLYSDIPSPFIDRQALHSHMASFKHPFTGNFMELTAPLPDDIKNLISVLQL